jgi:uncharacterized protein
MSERSEYPNGVPCWVDTLAPDPHRSMRFYERLFGWEFEGPGSTPGDPPGEYFVARLGGRDVAGLGSVGDENTPAAWSTYISVASVDGVVERATAAGAQLLAGPVQASPAGRLAVLADPAGAVFGVWEAEDRQGAQLVNAPSAWAMSMLQTSDPDGARRFYGELFGWEAEPLDMGGLEGMLWRLPGYLGGEPHQPVPRDVVAVMVPVAGEGRSQWNVDFSIDDADAAAATAQELGGAVLAPAHDTAGFRQAVLADPHGAVFSVSTLNA